jgi:galactose mutarotase-like enzyme
MVCKTTLNICGKPEKNGQNIRRCCSPIVGTLKENRYYYNGKEYTLSRHGFAREKVFSVVQQSPKSITFRLQNDEQTLLVYPFKFNLDISYELIEDTLKVTYLIVNDGDERMYFSIGAHPAFNVPLVWGKKYEDYSFEFDKKLTADCWLLDGALISENSKPFLQNQSNLPLHKSLFEKDALVFKGFDSASIKLVDSEQHGLDFTFHSCPFLGLWAATNAPFVCIEPWFGIADSVTANQQLQDKEGIQILEIGREWKYSWSVRLF